MMRRLKIAPALVLTLAMAFVLSPCAVSAADVATEAGSAAASARFLESLSWIIDSFLVRPHLRGAEISIIVESLDHESLYERHADRPMIPASNMKVVTAAAALSLLGPDYRFETSFSTDSDSVSPILGGNLYVKGSGDPSLVSEEFWKIADELRTMGIERITGDIVLDVSYFDGHTTATDAADDGDRAYHARTSALSANFNTVRVHVHPGGKSGEAARIELSPETGFVDILNDATSCSARRSQTIQVRRRFEDGRNVVHISGRIPVGHRGKVFYRNIDDPTGSFGATLISFLESAGIAFDGNVVQGAEPDDARELFVHRSKPLSLIVRDLNKFSNNFTAEQLLKTLGAMNGDGGSQGDASPGGGSSSRESSASGTTASGTGALMDYLEQLGIDTAELRIVDGSGLSRESRLTVRSLARVIREMYADFRVAPEYLSSLSVSGTDGTLGDRMGFGGLTGTIRAKTGLLDGVTAISGVMETTAGRRVLFSIIVNGWSCEAWKVHDMEHAILLHIYES
jgi:D-alanyl-D-alanine carboxypeptidase/D-alanyl-D-alanine-endopeptidase (penicillin-binding protein 4)